MRHVGYGGGVNLVPGAPDREQTRMYPPRAKLLVLAAGSLVAAGIGYLMRMADVAVLAGLGWILLVGFGLATALVLVRALRPGPTVAFDANGITDRTTLAPTGLVRWEDITVVRKREIGRGRGSERLLEVMLTDPDAFYARPRTVWRRLADRYRRLFKQPDVSLPGSMVDRPMQAVIDEIHRWRPDLQVLELPPPVPRLRHLFGRPSRPSDQHPKPPRW